MSKNVLVEGAPRIGWMIDGDPETPEIAVMLEQTPETVQLTVPTKGMFVADDPYSRWFSAGMIFGDDPDRTRYRYTPPPSLLFYDHLGSVTLVGCRQSASSSAQQVGSDEWLRITQSWVEIDGMPSTRSTAYVPKCQVCRNGPGSRAAPLTLKEMRHTALASTR